MSGPLIHHVEICVKDDEAVVRLLEKGFHFAVIAERSTALCNQTVLKTGSSVFIVTKRLIHEDNNHFPNDFTDHEHPDTSGYKYEPNAITLQNNVPNGEGISNEIIVAENNVDSNIDYEPIKCIQSQNILIDNNSELNNSKSIKNENILEESDFSEHWTSFCCGDEPCHSIDSVFNVALHVKNVDKITENIRKINGIVLKEPCDVSDSDGSVRYAIVRSCCGNIVHTLIDKSKYFGKFLPKFIITSKHLSKPNSNSILNSSGNQITNIQCPLTTHIDHVTYVCRPGESGPLIKWYEQCFSMKRFITNREESVEDGFVLGDNIGLRLKALEYWRCAETGLECSQSNADDQTLRLVIAEPYPCTSISHVDTFLKAHAVPGIQHIGLHTNDIINTVTQMSRNVSFRCPPKTYYIECGKLKDLENLGYTKRIEQFQGLGILLDIEPDVFTNFEGIDNRHLMQIFSEPLFCKDTFFMEIIQRVGAKGFGAGNITALANSILLQQTSQK